MIFLLILLIILILLLWNKGRNCGQPQKYTFKVGEKMIVKYLSGTPEHIKDENRKEYSCGELKICECANLEEWTLTKSVTVYGMEGVGGAMKPTPATGQGIDSVYINGKLKVDSQEKIEVTRLEYYNPGKNAERNLKIAVLDTGIDREFFTTNDFIENPSGCFEQDANNNFDDNPRKHGSIVTQFLLRQFNDSGINIKIIPFKVLDTKKEGDLFEIVCAIYAAQKQGANAIVASLGYLGEGWGLLKEALDFTKNNNVLYFAAAGNIANNSENSIFQTKNFFPATYSLINTRVFAVSSVRSPIKRDGNINWSPNQNSKKIMINAYVEINSDDSAVQDHFCYFNSHLTGTSYATPIFAGQYLRRNLESGSGPATNDKPYILNLFNEEEVEDLGQYGLAIRKNSYQSL